MKFGIFCMTFFFPKSYFELQKVYFEKKSFVFLSIGVILGFTKEFLKIGILMLHNVLLIYINPLLIALWKM